MRAEIYEMGHYPIRLERPLEEPIHSGEIVDVLQDGMGGEPIDALLDRLRDHAEIDLDRIPASRLDVLADSVEPLFGERRAQPFVGQARGKGIVVEERKNT